jgi:hypothetical protein
MKTWHWLRASLQHLSCIMQVWEFKVFLKFVLIFIYFWLCLVKTTCNKSTNKVNLLYRKVTDFCLFILYSASWLNVLSASRHNLISSFPVYILLFLNLDLLFWLSIQALYWRKISFSFSFQRKCFQFFSI